MVLASHIEHDDVYPMLMKRAFWIPIVLLGCELYKLPVEGYACSASGECPDGYLCDIRERVCHTATSDDVDQDGVPDAVDLCVDIQGSGQDQDDDGFGDECDNCPQVPNLDQADADGDQIGDLCTPPSIVWLAPEDAALVRGSVLVEVDVIAHASDWVHEVELRLVQAAGLVSRESFLAPPYRAVFVIDDFTDGAADVEVIALDGSIQRNRAFATRRILIDRAAPDPAVWTVCVERTAIGEPDVLHAQSASAGDTARILAFADGDGLQSLGEAAVVDGQATLTLSASVPLVRARLLDTAGNMSALQEVSCGADLEGPTLARPDELKIFDRGRVNGGMLSFAADTFVDALSPVDVLIIETKTETETRTVAQAPLALVQGVELPLSYEHVYVTARDKPGNLGARVEVVQHERLLGPTLNANAIELVRGVESDTLAGSPGAVQPGPCGFSEAHAWRHLEFGDTWIYAGSASLAQDGSFVLTGVFGEAVEVSATDACGVESLPLAPGHIDRTAVDRCSANHGGCGDARYFTCTHVPGGEPLCADVDECATDNGGCGDAACFVCTDLVGDDPVCTPVVPPTPSLTAPDTDARLSSHSVTFTFTAAQCAVGYRVQVSETNGFSLPTYDHEVPATAVSLELPADGTWYWRVAPLLQLGEAPLADAYTSARILHVDATPPSLASATAPLADPVLVSGQNVRYQWTAASDASGLSDYVLEIDHDLAFAPPIKRTVRVAETSYVDSRPLAGGTWYWRVTASDTYGNASTSLPVSFRIDVPESPPVAQAGEDRYAVSDQDTVLLDGSESYDPDNNQAELTYAWSFWSTPHRSVFNGQTFAVAAPSFAPDQGGTFILELVVTSEGEASTSDYVYVYALRGCCTTVTLGQGSSGTPGQRIAVEVRLANIYELPVRGAPFTLYLRDGTATAEPHSGLTDEDGRFATTILLGTTAGTVRFEAIPAGYSNLAKAELSLTVTAGPVAKLVLERIARVSVGTDTAVSVHTEDAFGNSRAGLALDSGIELSLRAYGPATFGLTANIGTLLDGGGSASIRGRIEQGRYEITLHGTDAQPIDLELADITGMGTGLEIAPEDARFDFETQTDDFTHEGQNNFSADSWEHGTPTSGPGGARSGTKLWATNLAGNYPDAHDASLLSPWLRVNDDGRAELSFASWFSSEQCCDKGTIEVRSAGDWEVVVPTSGYGTCADGFCGGPMAWGSVAIDLSPYAGQYLQVRWRLRSDGSVGRAGWYVDDVLFTGVAARTRFVAP